MAICIKTETDITIYCIGIQHRQKILIKLDRQCVTFEIFVLPVPQPAIANITNIANVALQTTADHSFQQVELP